MRLNFSSFLVVALLSWGSTALANETNVADQTASSTTMATLVCRPAHSGETASATTTDNVSLVCKPLDMKPIMEMKPHIEAMPKGDEKWKNLFSDFELRGGH
jgi:hypothetical protein